MRTIVFAFLLLALTQSAWAQGCPAGIQSAGNPACIPPDLANSPYYQGGYDSAQPSTPRGHWQLTWGAIALDDTTGDVGTSVGNFFKKDAKREAMTRCAAGVSNNCKIDLAYNNQCAVIATASRNGASIGGTLIVQGGPSTEIASQLAVSACIKMRNGGQCEIFYSECTKPCWCSDLHA